MRVRSRHGLRRGVRAIMVRRERRETAGRVGMVAVGMSAITVTSGIVEMVRGERSFALDLRGCRRKKVNVHGVMHTSGTEIAADVARQIGARVAGIGTRVAMRWGHVWRRQSRIGRRRAHRLGRRRHHLIHLVHLIHVAHLVHLSHLIHLVDLVHLIHLAHLVQLLQGWVLMLVVVEETGLGGSGGSSGGNGMLLVASARVGVIVYSRVSSQLVGSAEALGAAGKLARVWLLARVGANVSRLMFKAVKSLVAQRTLVWTRQVRTMILVLRLHRMRHGRDSGSSSGHGGRVGLDAGVDVRR